jgi:hypothetical protein
MGAAVEVSAYDMFVLAGWLEESGEITADERQWLALLRSLPDELRPLGVELARSVVSALAQPRYQRALRSQLRIADRPT